MRILVTGGSGFVGKNLQEYLESKKIYATFIDRKDGDLKEFNNAYGLIMNYDVVIHAAGLVGTGYFYNRNGASLYQTITNVDQNVIKACALYGNKLVYIGSASAYSPDSVKNGELKEVDFLNGLPDEYTLGYGYAKRNAYLFMKLCGAQYGLKSVYLAMSTMYGKHQNMTLDTGLFIPATITKFRQNLPEIVVHGTGKPVRDFLDGQSAAAIIYKFAESYKGLTNPEVFNVGGPGGLSVKEVVEILADMFDYKGVIRYNTNMSDGMIERKLNNSKLYEMFPEFRPTRTPQEIFKEKIKCFL